MPSNYRLAWKRLLGLLAFSSPTALSSSWRILRSHSFLCWDFCQGLNHGESGIFLYLDSHILKRTNSVAKCFEEGLRGIFLGCKMFKSWWVGYFPRLQKGGVWGVFEGYFLSPLPHRLPPICSVAPSHDATALDFRFMISTLCNDKGKDEV